MNRFKAILLGQWHSLSDPELQEALRIRLDFIAFCGFPLDKLPRLLNEINRQLQSHGLMMQKTKGAIVDTTWVKNGKKSHYGYRAYGVVDDEGYLLGSHTAPVISVSSKSIRKCCSKASAPTYSKR